MTDCPYGNECYEDDLCNDCLQDAGERHYEGMMDTYD